MSRSLLQANPSRKNGDSNLSLKQSRNKSFQGKLSNFTEVLIQTYDNEVPYIAIYKPDIKRQQRRVQAITAIDKCMKKFELWRLNLVFNKFNSLKHQENNLVRHIHSFQQLFQKMLNKRVMHSFLQLATNKIKKKNIAVGIKMLALFQMKNKANNFKQCMNRLKFNNYHLQITTLSNENQLTRQLSQANNQLFKYRSGTYDQSFLQKSKSFLKMNDHNTFIDSIREGDYLNAAKFECTRFEQNRLKSLPKKKDIFDNELIINVLNNVIRAYEANIEQHIRYEEELKQQLEGYTNTQGIAQLNQVLLQKDKIIKDLENFSSQIARMDSEMKRFSGQKFNSDKIISIITQQEKKLEVRSKKSQGMIPQLINSRLLLDSLIMSAFKRANEDKEDMNKQFNELMQAVNEQKNLKIFLKKLKDNPTIKTIAGLFLNLYEKINELTKNIDSLNSSKLDLTKSLHDLTAEKKQNENEWNQMSIKIEQLIAINQASESSIKYLEEFIKENQKRIESHNEMDLYAKMQINLQFQPLFACITNILRYSYSLQNQRIGLLRQIEQLQKRKSSPFSETKQVQVPSSPRKSKLEIRESQMSLAERFMTPLKQILENRQQDKQLKQLIQIFQQKIEEIISQNHFLQEKLGTLQTNDKIIDELTIRIGELKEENQNLKKNSQNYNNILKDYNDILHKLEQSKQKNRYLTQENLKIVYLTNQLSEYEFKLRQLSLINAELTHNIASLRQSNSQFSDIATSNLQLSQKINEIYNKSTSRANFESNEQQLIKQTQLMQEILTLKIQSENTAIRHMQEINSLRSEINSYQTIISKIEVDIAQRENQCAQKQNIIVSLNAKYSEMREVNIDLKQKIEEFQKVISVETTKKFKDDEIQLNRLRQDCANIYEQLQMTIDKLRGKDNQLHSLQFTASSQEEIIIALKKEKQRLMMNIQELIEKNEELQLQNSRSKAQFTQIKNQYHEIQLEFHKRQITQTQISRTTQLFQKQIQQKQLIINNLMEQSRTLSTSHITQLNQLKQQFMSKERILQQKLSDKDLRISKLQFELNEKINTVMSLEQLISLYASSSQLTLKEQINHFTYPYSRDKEILFLRGQIKSLEEFLNDMANQYQQLQKKYQQERQRTNRAYLNLSPISPDKFTEIKELKTAIFSEEHREARFLDDVSERFNHSEMSNINMTFTQSDIARQLNRLMASNQSLANSVDYLRGENKQLFMKVKSISSIEMVLELVYNILMNIGKFKAESELGGKVWQDLCHLRSVYSGETLFINLEDYCRQFVASC